VTNIALADSPKSHARLQPFALQDAPALIEAVFPAQKVSFEARRERKAGSGQTLTALGSYWKDRKPLILVRAIVLGSLLPQTDDAEKDLEIFEKLMAFDVGGLARRAPKISPTEIARRIPLGDPWSYFTASYKGDPEDAEEIEGAQFPQKRAGIDLVYELGGKTYRTPVKTGPVLVVGCECPQIRIPGRARLLRGNEGRGIQCA